MSIAAALNILVTAPTAELRGDLREMGKSVSEFRAVIRKAMEDGETSTDKLNKELDLLKVGLQRNILNWNEYTNAVDRTRKAYDDLATSAAKAQKAAFAAEHMTQFRGMVDDARKDHGSDIAKLGANIRERYAQQDAKAAQVQSVQDAVRASNMDLQIDRTKAASKATEEFTQKRMRANQLLANVSPLANLNLKLNEYNQLQRAGALTTAEHTMLVKAATTEYARQATVMGRAFGNFKQLLSATGLSNPYLAISVAVATSGREFLALEHNLSATQAWTGATADEMDRLRTAALEAGVTARFSASRVAEAQKYLASAGLSVDQVILAQQSAMDLATAGEMDLANATDIATRVMGAFELKASELPKVVDAVAVAAAHAVGSVENYAEAFKFVGPIAHQAGLSINETAAALMVLAKHGLVGELGGTGFRNVLARIVSPTEKASEAMSKYGIQIHKTSDGALDLLDLLQQMHDKLEKLDGVAKLQFLNEIGKTRSMSTLAALIANPEEFKSALTVQQAGAGSGAEQARVATNNIGDQWKAIANSLLEAATEFYEAIKPLLSLITDTIHVWAILIEMSVTGWRGYLALMEEFWGEAARILGDILKHLHIFGLAATGKNLSDWGKQFSKDAVRRQEELAELQKGHENALLNTIGFGATAKTVVDNGGVVRTGKDTAIDDPAKIKAMKDVTDHLEKQVAAREHAARTASLTKEQVILLEAAETGVNYQLQYGAMLRLDAAAQMERLGKIAEETRKAQFETQSAGLGKAETTRLAAYWEAEQDAMTRMVYAGMNLSEQLRIQLDLAQKKNEIDTATLNLAHALTSEALAKGLNESDSRSDDLRFQISFLERNHKEATALDVKMHELLQDAQDLDDFFAIADVWEAVAAEEKKLDALKEQVKARKELQDAASKAKENETPESKFQTEFAKIAAERAAGFLTGGEFAAAKTKLERQFMESENKFNGHEQNKPVEKGSQDEFKILYGQNATLAVNQNMLKELESSNVTLGFIKADLSKAGLVTVNKIPN